MSFLIRSSHSRWMSSAPFIASFSMVIPSIGNCGPSPLSLNTRFFQPPEARYRKSVKNFNYTAHPITPAITPLTIQAPPPSFLYLRDITFITLPYYQFQATLPIGKEDLHGTGRGTSVPFRH